MCIGGVERPALHHHGGDLLNRAKLAAISQRGAPRAAGFSLIEVMVTALIVSFGLLAVAAFQAKASLGEAESYQRAQAIALLADIQERIRLNTAQAASYVPTGAVGTGDAQPTDCTAIAAGAARDLCEWSNALKGTGEQKAGMNSAGLSNGRGCIQMVQAANTTPGSCLPAIYRLSVAWLGAHPTITPNVTCGTGQYGSDERLRRIVSAQLVLSTPDCS